MATAAESRARQTQRMGHWLDSRGSDLRVAQANFRAAMGLSAQLSPWGSHQKLGCGDIVQRAP